jgi:hypothetical protein
MAGNMDVASTMTFLQSLCTEPEQAQMINWMATQPPDKLITFLQNAIKAVPRESVPDLINKHLASQTPEVRNHIYTQLMTAYDFLTPPQ